MKNAFFIFETKLGLVCGYFWCRMGRIKIEIFSGTLDLSIEPRTAPLCQRGVLSYLRNFHV